MANANGAGYASFTFQVQDDGGTANGGVDLDQSANTMTIDVTAVNDAPAGTNNTVTTLEDTAYTFAAADFGFSDAADTSGQRAERGEDHHAAGSGQPDQQRRAGQRRASSSARPTSRAASWCSPRWPTPTARATRASASRCKTTAAPPTVAWTWISRANTMSIDVTAVNDAPAGTDNTVTTLEDTRVHVCGS